MNTIEYREKYNNLLYEKNSLKNELKKTNTKLFNEKKEYEILLKAQSILQNVAKNTQNQIKLYITNIVNEALNSIPFEEDPGVFKMEFVDKRNQIECVFYFDVGGEKRTPLISQGGGVLSVTSFALLLACWSLQKSKNNTIILDEPFKDINDPDDNLNLKFYISEMIKKICKLLNIQLIIIGNNNSFNNFADKLFLFNVKNGKTIINEKELNNVKF